MQERKPTDFLFFFLLVLLFIFVCVRSVMTDFTHDEAYSFLNIKKFWYAQFLCNANSHWINSMAMKTASMFGLESNWQLRWFSIVCSGGILSLTYYWINGLSSFSIKLFAFSLACLNLFVLDYFVLARGYVSGMFFEVLSLGLFLMALQYNKPIVGRVALFCAGLSAIANFNFFYFFIAFTAVYHFTLYFKKGASSLRNKRFYFDTVIALGFVLLVLRALLFIKRCSNDLGLGAEAFIPAIFSSFLDGITYKNIGIENTVLNSFAIGFALLVFASAVYGVLRSVKHKNPLYRYSSVIFLLIIATLVFNHYVFHIVYPYYRSALPLFPLMVIMLVAFLHHTLPETKIRATILGLASLILFVNFFMNVSLRSTFDFYHQHDAKPAFELVQKLGGKHVGMSHEHFGVYINYYQPSNKYKYSFAGVQLNTYDDNKEWKEKNLLEYFDYLILYPPYELKYYKKRKIHFSGVTVFPVSGTVVLKVN